jgi:hypothetical protein
VDLNHVRHVFTELRFNPTDLSQTAVLLVFTRWIPRGVCHLGVIVLALYPVCHWYAGLKARRHDAWLRYL